MNNLFINKNNNKPPLEVIKYYFFQIQEGLIEEDEKEGFFFLVSDANQEFKLCLLGLRHRGGWVEMK